MMDEYERLYTEFLKKAIRKQRENIEMRKQLKRIDSIVGCCGVNNCMSYWKSSMEQLRGYVPDWRSIDLRNMSRGNIIRASVVLVIVFVLFFMIAMF